MIRNILVAVFVLFFGVNLFAATDTNSTAQSMEQTLVVSYDELPVKLYKNQVFAIKLKALVGATAGVNLVYTANNAQGLKPVNQNQQFMLDKDGAFTVTLLYKVAATMVRTPDFTVNFSGGSEKEANTLEGKSYIPMIPAESATSTGVVAQSLKVSNYKIDKYDSDNNILALEVTARQANLDEFRLKNIASQGVSSLKITNQNSVLVYHLVAPGTQDLLEFQYFNSEKDQLETVSVKLDLTKIEDKVSTQTDLSPKSHDKAMYVFIVVTLIATVLFAIYYFRRERIFLILIFGVIGAGCLFLFVPNEEAKLKKDCVVYLLPTESSTSFYKASEDVSIERLKESDNFIKIKLKDGKIGWVRSECVNKN